MGLRKVSHEGPVLRFSIKSGSNSETASSPYERRFAFAVDQFTSKFQGFEQFALAGFHIKSCN